jgi:hypothetical protein
MFRISFVIDFMSVNMKHNMHAVSDFMTIDSLHCLS